MIENRPVARMVAHLMLILGIIVVAFPIYYTFVASSMTSTDIIRPPMSLLPGDHLGANYTDAMAGGVERVVGVSLERLLFNSFVVALAIASARSSSRSCRPSPSSSSAFPSAWAFSG